MTSGPVDAYYHPAEFRVGQALSRAFSVLFGNFPTFIAISAIASLPDFFYEWGASGRAMGAYAWVPVTLRFVLAALCEAMILYATFQALRGRPVRAGESIARGLARLAPVLIASFLVTMIITLGTLLLVIPGLIAYVMLALTLPVCVVERLGPLSSMSRSVELTRGYRWHIFGALLLVIIVQLVIVGVLAAVIAAADAPLASAAVQFLATTLFQAYQSVLIAIMYHDLRVVKDGIDLEQIASVFD